MATPRMLSGLLVSPWITSAPKRDEPLKDQASAPGVSADMPRSIAAAASEIRIVRAGRLLPPLGRRTLQFPVLKRVNAVHRARRQTLVATGWQRPPIGDAAASGAEVKAQALVARDIGIGRPRDVNALTFMIIGPWNAVTAKNRAIASSCRFGSAIKAPLKAVQGQVESEFKPKLFEC